MMSSSQQRISSQLCYRSLIACVEAAAEPALKSLMAVSQSRTCLVRRSVWTRIPPTSLRQLLPANYTCPITLYTGESPYEKLKLKKAQQHLRKEREKEQRRAERKLAQKGLAKDANKAELKDWAQENSADELNTDDNEYELQTTNQQEDEMAYKKPETPTSPCTLWNSNFKEIPRQKNLHIEDLIAERDQFLKLCSKNRFYANPNFDQPWRVFSKLANRLSNDIIGVIEEDFSIGVSKFVQDFLDNETKI